jgi:hypothetical protein
MLLSFQHSHIFVSSQTAVRPTSLQDLSYLTAPAYAALMRQWLSKAKPLSAILQGSRAALRDYCNITQPPDPDQSDVYLTYRDNADFERIGRELAPMLFSVSGGVSGVRLMLLNIHYSC